MGCLGAAAPRCGKGCHWLHICPGVNSTSPVTGAGLRDLRNSITLAQLPAVASLLTRYRLFLLQFKFLSTKDDV